MVDTRYYDREIRYLREAGRKYADKYPMRASKLRLESSEYIDPRVERLIESFAFMTARVQKRLDEDFPDLCETFLSILCPVLNCPIPSFTIVRFEPNEKMVKKETIEKGAVVESVPITSGGTICRFQTTAPVDVYPLSISRIEIIQSTEALPCLRMRLSLFDQIRSDVLQWSNLRFYLQGDTPIQAKLYELFHTHVQSIVIRSSEGRRKRLDSSQIAPVPYSVDESILPQPDHVHGGIRLLLEYFLFPERDSFFDLSGLEFLRKWPPFTELDIDFELDPKSLQDLYFEPENILLGCVPAVNLFPADGIPISLDSNELEYRLEADDLGPQEHYAIYSVDKIFRNDFTSGESEAILPFQGFLPKRNGNAKQVYYQVSRRPDISGSIDYWLRLTNHAGEMESFSSDTLSIQLTCTNGDLAATLRPKELSIPGEGVPESVAVHCLLTPTKAIAPPLFRQRARRYWHLLSHVSSNLLPLLNKTVLLNTIDLIASHAGLDVSDESIMNMDARRSTAWRRRLDSIEDVRCEPTEDIYKGTIIRGIKVTIVISDEDRFEYPGELLKFMNVLSNFFSFYVTLNSFADLVLVLKREDSETVWPGGFTRGRLPIV